MGFKPIINIEDVKILIENDQKCNALVVSEQPAKELLKNVLKRPRISSNAPNPDRSEKGTQILTVSPLSLKLRVF